MTKFILHIGPHKTGTTSLQNCLAENRQKLLRSGILYPKSVENAIYPEQHSDLVWIILREDWFLIESYIEKIYILSKKNQIDLIFLSGEEFVQLIASGLLDRFIKIIESHCDVTILYVKRDITDLAVSNYKQLIYGNIEELLRWRGDIEKFISDFVTYQFDNENWVASRKSLIIEYDDLNGDDYTKKIIKLVSGLELDYLKTNRMNQSKEKDLKLFLSYSLRLLLADNQKLSSMSESIQRESLNLFEKINLEEAKDDINEILEINIQKFTDRLKSYLVNM